MIVNVNLFSNLSLLDFSLLLNALWLTTIIHHLCGRSQTKLGWSSLLLLGLALPVSFAVYSLLGHNQTLRMVELALTRICLIIGLILGMDWLNQTFMGKLGTKGRRGAV